MAVTTTKVHLATEDTGKSTLILIAGKVVPVGSIKMINDKIILIPER